LTPDLHIELWLERWHLVADGAPTLTPSSLLLAVRRNGQPAMLKIAREEEERRGGRLMAWWDGDGAARVLAQDDRALLLERTMGSRSLAAMAARGEDDEASRILCAVAAKLHAPRPRPPPDLVPLAEWFEMLAPAANALGGLLAEAKTTADKLLATPRDVAVLHGDIHHGNVLDAGERGWIAIDPKGLWGERTFDFVNILRNPDAATALTPGRFARQVEVVASAAALERHRLLEWTLAFAALSAAWYLADGEPADFDLAVCALAAAALRG
jgi:streptomycin 6-kinase